MAKLALDINDKLMAMVKICVRQLWPNEDARAVGRFIKDALKRYIRYCNGKS